MRMLCFHCAELYELLTCVKLKRDGLLPNLSPNMKWVGSANLMGGSTFGTPSAQPKWLLQTLQGGLPLG